MTRKQSIRRQRALWRGMSGPSPKGIRWRAKNPVALRPEPSIRYQPGNCGACGNTCSCADVWMCLGCGVTFPAVTAGQVAVAFADRVEIRTCS